MLTTLIYRSQMHLTQETDLILLVEKANAENAARGITGILLLKDNVYLQILEGDECVLEQPIQHDKARRSPLSGCRADA